MTTQILKGILEHDQAIVMIIGGYIGYLRWIKDKKVEQAKALRKLCTDLSNPVADNLARIQASQIKGLVNQTSPEDVQLDATPSNFGEIKFNLLYFGRGALEEFMAIEQHIQKLDGMQISKDREKSKLEAIALLGPFTGKLVKYSWLRWEIRRLFRNYLLN